jgi:hypothetical protein
MRTDQEIIFMIERIESRLNSEVLQKPINTPVLEAYLKGLEILKKRETNPFKAGLNFKDLNQHSFTQFIINQMTAWITGDVYTRLVFFSVFPDGTIDEMKDLDDLPPISEPEPTIINTMNFHDQFFKFDNPIYALRYCSADGNSPFMQGCPWDLSAKSVTAGDAGIFAVPIDFKKIINPDGTIRENYIKGVVKNPDEEDHNIIILLLESDPEFLIESNPFNVLGEPMESKEFREAIKSRNEFKERAFREFGAVFKDISSDEILKAQTLASREISFSRANIIMIGKYGETGKLIKAAIRNNIKKGRKPLTGLNFIPELKEYNSWIDNN